VSKSTESYIWLFVGPCNYNAPDMRLVDGTSAVEGHVKVIIDRLWGTVYADSWDLDDALVVCKRLDCPSVTSASISFLYTQGSFSIIMS
jgi:hypothetical protein